MFRGFVATYSRWKNQHIHWVCSMSMSRKDGSFLPRGFSECSSVADFARSRVDKMRCKSTSSENAETHARYKRRHVYTGGEEGGHL